MLPYIRHRTHNGTLVLTFFVLFFLIYQLWDRYGSVARTVPSLSQTNETNRTSIRNSISWEDFPKRIWTTAPLSPMRIKRDDADHVRTWMDLNPEHRYELLTDKSAETYVKDSFSDNRKVLDTYMSISDFILRADLVRYLALLHDGGVYNDLDVTCLRPIDLWIPPKFKDRTSVVLGVEADNEMGHEGSKLFGLVNWTVMARRDQPFMRYLVDRVIRNLEEAASKHNTTLGDLKLYRQEVLDVTGPQALTQAAFQYLSDVTQTTVNIQNFTKMKQPRLIEGILILPINAFGAGHQVQWSGAVEDGSALVHHHFAGSWKNSHIDGPSEEGKKKEEEKKEEEKNKEEVKKKAEEKKQEDEKEKRKKEDKQKTVEADSISTNEGAATSIGTPKGNGAILDVGKENMDSMQPKKEEKEKSADNAKIVGGTARKAKEDIRNQPSDGG